MPAKKAPVKKAAAKPAGKPPSIIETRQGIQTRKLVQTLENFAFGKQKLSQAQVSAIKILLGKTLPDLRQHQIEAAPDTNSTISWMK
jgi:hypothetical protein